MSDVVHGRGRLTSRDHERIHELAERGMKSTAIARAIKKHPSTVGWFMYSRGLKAPTQQVRAAVHYRAGRPVFRFSADEDAFIEALRIQDFSVEKIAELASKRFSTVRRPHTIRCRLKMLAAMETA